MPAGPADDRPLPGPDDIRALLEFLPLFESPDFVFAEQVGGRRDTDGVFTLPFWGMTDEAARFHHVLHDRGFVRPFDWVAWKREAERLVDDPDALARAGLDTICKLLTAHVRQERFCEGHLLSMYKCGHLAAVLRRLAALADSG